MKISTIGQLLHWSYANLAMAHAAISEGSTSYLPHHYMIRSRLYRGLEGGNMTIGALFDDERLKMLLPQACWYCGAAEALSADHLLPRKRGGADSGENLVWACRRCNGSKGARDVLEWFHSRGVFPPVFLLRRYLKLAIEICEERMVMETPLDHAPELPFALAAVPRRYPPPSELRLFVQPEEGPAS